MIELFTLPWGHLMSSTVASCQNEAHCWHGGTAVGSYYCCKCGATIYEALHYSVSFNGDTGSWTFLLGQEVSARAGGMSGDNSH
jgi:hypothetical protein